MSNKEQRLVRRVIARLFPASDGWQGGNIEYLLTDPAWKDTPRAARVRELFEIARQRRDSGQQPMNASNP